MKTSVKTLSAILIVISLNANAQKRSRGNEVQQPQHPNSQTNTINTERHVWTSNGHGGPNVSVNIGGGYSNYGGNYYNYTNYGYNNNYYNIRNAARNSLHQSANVIGQALQFSEWNDIYSPWLAKAIQHQQYARQLYFWGDYAGALNHAERAGFLAWNTLSYCSNGYDNYSQNNYPNPYSDPNNPYYRQNNGSNTTQQNANADDYGYRKQNSDANSLKNPEKQASSENFKKTELDKSLPQSSLSDKELLKVSVKDLDIE